MLDHSIAALVLATHECSGSNGQIVYLPQCRSSPAVPLHNLTPVEPLRGRRAGAMWPITVCKSGREDTVCLTPDLPSNSRGLPKRSSRSCLHPISPFPRVTPSRTKKVTMSPMLQGEAVKVRRAFVPTERRMWTAPELGQEIRRWTQICLNHWQYPSGRREPNYAQRRPWPVMPP